MRALLGTWPHGLGLRVLEDFLKLNISLLLQYVLSIHIAYDLHILQAAVQQEQGLIKNGVGGAAIILLTTTTLLLTATGTTY